MKFFIWSSFFLIFYMNQLVANRPPPMRKWPKRQTRIKYDFAFLFFTFLLLLPRELVLEREQTMTDEEHFLLHTSKSEVAAVVVVAP